MKALTLLLAVTMIITNIFVGGGTSCISYLCCSQQSEENTKKGAENMANTPVINVDGTDYNVKDAQARQDIENLYLMEGDILSNYPYTANYTWKHDSQQKTAGSGYRAFDAIPIKKGVTYYYKNIATYFSIIVYSTGTLIPLTSGAYLIYSGSFTAAYDGVVCISAKDDANYFFTDDSMMISIDDAMQYANFHDGYFIYSDGTEQASSDYTATDYIRLNSDFYTLRFADACYIAFYDYTKTYISNSWRNMYSWNVIDSRFKVPEGAEFIKISFLKSKKSHIKFSTLLDGKFYASARGYYTKFVDAFADAILQPNQEVILPFGTFDLYTELGSSYFENYESTRSALVIQNGVKITGASDAKIVFNYTGNNDYVKQFFSIFDFGPGGGELNDLHLEASNCRYVIHDEHYSDDSPYWTIIRNCSMKIDNTENQLGYPQCIGGGCGKRGTVIIENCILETETQNAEVLSYHNTEASTGRSRIVVEGCYCINGTIRFSWYGTSTEITEIICTNNSIPSDIVVRAENASAQVNNINVMQWNNVVRN